MELALSTTFQGKSFGPLDGDYSFTYTERVGDIGLLNATCANVHVIRTKVEQSVRKFYAGTVEAQKPNQ